MKVGDKIRDGLFLPNSPPHRGNGTIIEIHPIESEPKGFFYAVVKWDNPIPECALWTATEYEDDISEGYLDDLIPLENEE